MSGTPVEIHWFPRNCDRFVTWGSEINLYQVRNLDEVDHRVSTSASQFILHKILIKNYIDKLQLYSIFFII